MDDEATLRLSLIPGDLLISPPLQVEVNGRSLSIISEALGGSNIDNCPHACLAKPCGPLAKCVPSLESYECKCNPQNEQCNRAEEIPINFIERRMQQQIQGPMASVVEAYNEEDEEEGEGESSSTLSPTEGTMKTTTMTKTTTTTSPTTTTTKRVEATLIDYQQQQQQEEADDDEEQNTPFALPIKINFGKSEPLRRARTGEDGLIDDEERLNDPVTESSVSSESSETSDEYFYAEEDVPVEEEGNILETPTISEGANGEKVKMHLVTTTIQPSSTSSVVKSIEGESETTHWSSITRDGEQVALPEESASISDNENFVWDVLPQKGAVTEQQSSVEEDDDDDDYFEDEVKSTDETFVNDDDEEEDEDMDDDLEDFLRPFKIELPEWKEDKSDVGEVKSHDEFLSQFDATITAKAEESSPFDSPNAADPFLKSHEFLVDLDRIMKGKEGGELIGEERDARPLTTSTSVRPEPTTKSSRRRKNRGSCFTGVDSFFHYSEGDTMRRMANKLDINLRFKSHSNYGLLLWTGRHAARINDNFLLLGIENG